MNRLPPRARWGPGRIEEALRGELDLNQLDAHGFGALHWCIDRRNRPLFERLLAGGVEVDLATAPPFGSPPLHWAMYCEETYFAAGLLAAGATPDRTDAKGWTALHIAAGHGKVDHVQSLLQHGASANLRSAGGTTALDEALLGCHPAAAALLFDQPGAELHTLEERLFLAAGQQSSAIVELLLQRGADPTAKSPHGVTVLEMAQWPRYEDDDWTDEEKAADDKERAARVKLIEAALLNRSQGPVQR